MPEELLDADQVARIFGLKNRRTILEMADRGELPCVRVGSRVRFRQEDIDEYILTHRQEGPKEK